QRPAGATPAPRPDPDERLIYPALDLGAAGEDHCGRELAYLSPLAQQPGAVLDRWEQELSGLAGEGPAAGRGSDFLLRYCRVVDLSAPAAEQFLEHYHGLVETVLRAGLPADLAQSEDRERVRRWADDHQALAERLECGPWFVERLRDYLGTLKDKLLTPWD